MSILNSPIKIGDLTIKNRLVMPPMATAKATDDGQVTKQICDYYHEKSFGGYIGLIITEHSYVNLVMLVSSAMEICPFPAFPSRLT